MRNEININMGIQQTVGDHSSAMIGGGNRIGGNKFNENISDGGKITEKEWKMLEEFLVEKQLEYGPRDERYGACSKMVEQVEKRDEGGLKRSISKIGKSIFDAILGVGVSSAVRTAILTIIDKL